MLSGKGSILSEKLLKLVNILRTANELARRLVDLLKATARHFTFRGIKSKK